VTHLGTPLPLTIVIVVAVGALLGSASERFGLRRCRGRPHIAPLLANDRLSFVLDQLVQLTFSPDRAPCPASCWTIGSRSVRARSVRSTW